MSDNITSLSQDVKKLAVKDSKQVNILLLGETGVGKSTFINAIANYLHFEKFKRAEKEPLRVLIPATITITDDNFQQKKISVGKSDKNEFLAVGAAATQGVKSYVFQIGDGKVNLRLIDTPGMGDPKGVEQDNKNCENILAYLSQLQDLHAICFLMKPTNPRITVMFEYCFKQILSRLDASASKNIVFIFTHTRSEHYRGGETFPCLEKVVKEIMDKQPKVKIAMDKNVFYVDNEAFRILAAMSNGVTFGEQTRPLAVESWKTSSKECWRLINYILGDPSNDPLPPHQLRNSTSINEARRLITHLSQPLVEITQLISDNIRILDRHRHDLNVQSESLDEMKKKMYIPVVNLKVTSLPEPATVCTSSKCVDFVKIGNETLKHYKRRCHERCYLPSITQEMIGEPGLAYCDAMENKMCKKCTCDFSVHMHVYYLTTPFDDKIEDINVVQNIATEERALEETLKLLEKIDDRKKDLEKERDAIVNATAKFASFLQNNAITPFNDSYKAYIEYMITREKGFGLNADPRVIKNLENLMSSHDELKKVFDEQNIDKGDDDVATNHTVARTVMDTVFNLYKLPLYGKQIRKLMQNQVGSRKYEYNQNCEYVHPEYVKSVSVDKKKDQSDAESKKKNKEAKDKKKEKSEGDSKKGKKDEKEGKPDSKKGKKDEKEDKPESKKGKKDEKESKSDGGTKKKEQFKPKPQQQQQRREPPPPYAEQQNVQKSNDNDSTIKVNIQLTQPKTKEQFPPPPQHYPPPAYGQPPYAYGAPGGNYYGPPGPQGYGPPPPPPGPHGYGPPPTPPGPHGYGPQPPAHQGGLPSYPPQWYQPQPPPAAASYWPPPYDSSSSYPQPPSGGQKSNSNRKQGGKPVEKQQNKPKKDNTKKKTKKSSDSSE